MRFYQTPLLCLATVIAGALPVAAAPAMTTWTTFLYQGPGDHYAVIDEVPEFSKVDMAACNKDWCRVTFGARNGYLKAEVVVQGDLANPGPGKLAQPAAALAGHPAAEKSCFEANQTGGNGGNATTVFCQR